MYKFWCEYVFIFLDMRSPGSGITESCVTLCSALWGRARLAFHSGRIILHSHPWCTTGPMCLHPCRRLLPFLKKENYSYRRGCEEASNRGFDLHSYDLISLMTNDVESIFASAYWPFVYILWRNFCPNPVPIFKLCYLCFYGWVVKATMYSGYWILIKYMTCKYFFAIWVAIYFLDSWHKLDTISYLIL